jgi:hypothetical protein
MYQMHADIESFGIKTILFTIKPFYIVHTESLFNTHRSKSFVGNSKLLEKQTRKHDNLYGSPIGHQFQWV